MSQTLRSVFSKPVRVAVPMIQRDYAHGRPEVADVRGRFLDALQDALERPASDPRVPLDLDFVYGSRPATGEFSPLDGQQRLTTLFLLHWYLARRDDELEDFHSWARVPVRDGARLESAFSYDVRSSARDFFDGLVHADIDIDDLLGGVGTTDALSRTICDRPWFLRSWLYDPTVQSCLVVLDAIHRRFLDSEGLYRRLVDEDHPAITFQFLDLDQLGLTDDLYIKMNARGKPLTEFETFKASFQQAVEERTAGRSRPLHGSAGETDVSLSTYVANRFDTSWCDLFWWYRGEADNADLQTMNAIRAVALAVWSGRAESEPEEAFLETLESLRAGALGTFYDFDRAGCIDEGFIDALIALFDRWASEDGRPGAALGDTRYYDEAGMFEAVLEKGHLGTRLGLNYDEWVQFVGWCAWQLAELPDEGLGDWMRVVSNLAVNRIFNRRAEFRNALLGLRIALTESGGAILDYLAGGGDVAGFTRQQVREEQFKAQLFARDSGWRPLIERAEIHGYFRGQVEFLLDFSGVLERWLSDDQTCRWDETEDATFRAALQTNLRRAEGMFRGADGEKSGLRPLGDFLWERALLCEGNYLLSNRLNSSFLEDGEREVSWKRLLRGDLRDEDLIAKRGLLRRLFDRIDADDLEGSLRRRIDAGVDDDPTDRAQLSGWRRRLVDTPDLIRYCGQRFVRMLPGDTIYLLLKKQRNGRHKDLFVSHLKYRVADLQASGELDNLSDVDGIGEEVMGDLVWPTVRLRWRSLATTRVDFYNGRFHVQVSKSLVDPKVGDRWEVEPDGIDDALRALNRRAG